MAVNRHFHTSGVAAVTTEQNLYRDLISEAIQIYGHDVYYINRTLVAEDTILGEDSLSVFRDATKIEMYMEDSDGGFAGEREIMNQFGLQNLSEATFVVSKERFQGKTKQITIESGTDSTEGGSILLESGSISSSIDLEGEEFYILNETDAADTDRPYEGDALYHPILKKMFQINYVDDDEPFFQLDNNPVYKLRCRLFDYSSEALDTGIDTIDAIEDALSTVSSDFQFTLEQNTATVDAMLLEDEEGRLIHQTESDELVALESSTMTTSAGSVLSETGDYLVQESYIIGDADTDKSSQNELFDTLDDTVLDFTESNPFGDVGST
jgi:hypothetical protein